ncbi:MAG: TolC family protein [Opitutaceae bacterium]|nr:TolC family protein [Opitutaceae bacterium]
MRPSSAALLPVSTALACALLAALPSAAQDAAAPTEAPPAAASAAGTPAPDGNTPFTAPVTIPGETIIPITLEDAVQLALASNLGLRVETFNRDTAREAVIIARAAYEPVFSVSASTYEAETPNTTSTVDSTSSTRLSGSASVSQKVDTGATLTLQSNLGRSEQQGGAALTNLYFGSDLALTVRQPLLAGAGFKVNRAARDRARIGVERSDITYEGQALDIIRDTELAFYTLASAHYALDVQRSGLATAEQFLNENEARRSAGIATELDVMQARVSVANRQSLIISAEQRVRDATDQLLALFGRRDFSGILQPTGYVFAPPAALSVEASYGRAAETDATVRSNRGLLRQLELDALVANNGKLPRLDLVGNAGINGSDRYTLANTDPDLGGAVDDMLEGDAYNWQVQLNLTLPWGMREARARKRIADYNVEQQMVRLEQLEQSLMVNVRAAVRAVEADRQTVEINALSTELSKREFELEKAKFDSGLSTSRLVVEAQQRWDEAKVREIQSRVQLRQDMARLRRLEGGSLQLYGVTSLDRAQ